MSENVTLINQEESEKGLPEQLPCEALWQLEHAGERPNILDVREQDEWDAGHIEWATHLPLSNVREQVEKIFPNKNELIISCCASGGRSAKAVDIMKELGYTNVKNLIGGYTGYCGREDNPEEMLSDEEGA